MKEALSKKEKKGVQKKNKMHYFKAISCYGPGKAPRSQAQPTERKSFGRGKKQDGEIRVAVDSLQTYTQTTNQ